MTASCDCPLILIGPPRLFHIKSPEFKFSGQRKQEVVVRIPAEITWEVHASFSLTMTDPIDKDEIDMGSQSLDREQSFNSDVLITFEGDFSRGLVGVSVEEVELVDVIPTVEFGKIDGEWEREADYQQYLKDMAWIDEVRARRNK